MVVHLLDERRVLNSVGLQELNVRNLGKKIILFLFLNWIKIQLSEYRKPETSQTLLLLVGISNGLVRPSEFRTKWSDTQMVRCTTNLVYNHLNYLLLNKLCTYYFGNWPKNELKLLHICKVAKTQRIIYPKKLSRCQFGFKSQQPDVPKKPDDWPT